MTPEDRIAKVNAAVARGAITQTEADAYLRATCGSAYEKAPEQALPTLPTPQAVPQPTAQPTAPPPLMKQAEPDQKARHGVILAALLIAPVLVIIACRDYLSCTVSISYCAYFTVWVSTWSCTSDARMKENITDLEPSLTTLMQLRPRRFTMKSTGEHRAGFIAQEVDVIIPEIVDKSNPEMYTITAIPDHLIVKAVQEQQAEIEQLNSTIQDTAASQQQLKEQLDAVKVENAQLRSELDELKAAVARLQADASP